MAKTVIHFFIAFGALLGFWLGLLGGGPIGLSMASGVIRYFMGG